MGKPLLFEDCVLVNNKIYFVGYNVGALFSMDINTGNLEYIDRIPNAMIIQCRVVIKILSYHDKLFLIPGRTVDNYIWTFDLKKKKWNAIEFRDEGVCYPYEKFSYAVMCNNEVFIVGCYYPSIICLDLDTDVIKYYPVFLNDMGLHSTESCLFAERKIYISDPNGNGINIFSIDNRTVQYVQIGDKSNTYGGITKCEGKFWLIPFVGRNIVQWNGKTESTEYSLPYDYDNMGGHIFNGVTSYDDSIYCIGLKEKKSFIFQNQKYEDNRILPANYIVYKVLENNQFLLQDYAGNVQIISGKEIKKYKLQISNEDYGQLIRKYRTEVNNKEDFVQEENFFWDLEDFINILR